MIPCGTSSGTWWVSQQGLNIPQTHTQDNSELSLSGSNAMKYSTSGLTIHLPHENIRAVFTSQCSINHRWLISTLLVVCWALCVWLGLLFTCSCSDLPWDTLRPCESSAATHCWPLSALTVPTGLWQEVTQSMWAACYGCVSSSVYIHCMYESINVIFRSAEKNMNNEHSLLSSKQERKNHEDSQTIACYQAVLTKRAICLIGNTDHVEMRGVERL